MIQNRITKLNYAYHISAAPHLLAEKSKMFHIIMQKLNMSESQWLEVSVLSSDMYDTFSLAGQTDYAKKYLLTGSIRFSLVLFYSSYTTYCNYITFNYITAM